MPTIKSIYYEITNERGSLAARGGCYLQTLQLLGIMMEGNAWTPGFCATVTKVCCYTDERPEMGFIRPKSVVPPPLHLPD
jgi:hypothetical protein